MGKLELRPLAVGLGLTIVYNVGNEHNGKVWAESNEFRLDLPVTIQLPLWKQH